MNLAGVILEYKNNSYTGDSPFCFLSNPKIHQNFNEPTKKLVACLKVLYLQKKTFCVIRQVGVYFPEFKSENCE